MKLPFRISIYIVLVLSIFIYSSSCKKYKDPAPQLTGLITPYCNDPKAVNYNWGFPGVPNNSICIYPAEVFVGEYKVYDSILNVDGVFVANDSFTISIQKVLDTFVNLIGFCTNNDTITAIASKNLRITIDTVASIGKGQYFCTTTDTINGFAVKQNINDTIFDFNYTLLSSTKDLHKATFNKK